MDERGVLHNDLWLAQPDYEYNKYMIAAVDHDFVGEKKLGLTLSKVEDFSGQPPCPRSQFQMITLKSAGERLILIYGGRNDVIYPQTSNIALNDICIFNVN